MHADARVWCPFAPDIEIFTDIENWSLWRGGGGDPERGEIESRERRDRKEYRSVPSPLQGTSQRIRSNRRYLSSSEGGMLSPTRIAVLVWIRGRVGCTFLEGGSFRLLGQFYAGESLRSGIGYEETRAVQLQQLVCQHVASLFVHIIRNHRTGCTLMLVMNRMPHAHNTTQRSAAEPFTAQCTTMQHNKTQHNAAQYRTPLTGKRRGGGAVMKEVDELTGFRSRCGTHVQHPMLRSNIQQQRGNHAHCLLSHDVALQKEKTDR